MASLDNFADGFAIGVLGAMLIGWLVDDLENSQWRYCNKM
jgi:hypothetical protein